MNGSDNLRAWGWTDKLQSAYEQLELESERFLPGRVLSQREDTFSVVTQEGLKWAHPAGVLFHRKTARDRPGVGDWVVLEHIDCPNTELEPHPVTHCVVEVLPRTACFVREAPGGRGAAQVVATNVDKIFIVNPANDINLNRIERFAVAIASGGAVPAVILSKGDLVTPDTLEEARSEVRGLSSDMQVLCTSGAQERCPVIRHTFESVLQPGRTYALIGASGVGKSTLVNALLNEARQDTGGVREGDQKGRHVTTFRELFPLPSGALIMDTPGVREFAMWAQGEGLSYVFRDIEDLQELCRFADCSHRTEPGCAVKEAIECGKMSQRRVANWQSLQQEMEENRERRERLKSRRERSSFRRKVKRDKRFSR